MKDQYAAAREFMHRHGMLADDIDRERELARFMEDMDRVSRGGKGTVRMIASYIGRYLPEEGSPGVMVLDIGGTNVRSAMVLPDKDGPGKVVHLPPFLTPGVEEETDTASFYLEIARRVCAAPEWDACYLGSRGRDLGICFSLATIPQDDRDAVMAAGGKQIRIRDMLGKKVGESFRQALAALGQSCDHRITVTNDSVAAALAGCMVPGADRYSGYVGFIYGTGTNLCCRMEDGTMVNVESGAYCGFPTGDIDDAFDRTLIDTGDDRFEKMVSGGYQGGLMEQILSAAAVDGLISRDTFDRIMADGPLEARDISAFAYEPEGSGRIAAAVRAGKEGVSGESRERVRILHLIDLVTKRSACLCSIAITGVLLYAGIGRDASAPALIMAEGSTFLKQKDFREQLDGYMEELAGREYALSWEFQTMEDAVLRGTAVASLSR